MTKDMKPTYINSSIRAHCPGRNGAISGEIANAGQSLLIIGIIANGINRRRNKGTSGAIQ